MSKLKYINIAYSKKDVAVPLGMKKIDLKIVTLVNDSILQTIGNITIKKFCFIDRKKETAFILFDNEDGYKTFIKKHTTAGNKKIINKHDIDSIRNILIANCEGNILNLGFLPKEVLINRSTKDEFKIMFDDYGRYLTLEDCKKFELLMSVFEESQFESQNEMRNNTE